MLALRRHGAKKDRANGEFVRSERCSHLMFTGLLDVSQKIFIEGDSSGDLRSYQQPPSPPRTDRHSHTKYTHHRSTCR